MHIRIENKDKFHLEVRLLNFKRPCKDDLRKRHFDLHLGLPCLFEMKVNQYKKGFKFIIEIYFLHFRESYLLLLHKHPKLIHQLLVPLL